MAKNNWTAMMPVYVTRKDAHGDTGSFSLSIWMVLLAGFLIWFNLA
jgi:hypothetical protein